MSRGSVKMPLTVGKLYRYSTHSKLALRVASASSNLSWSLAEEREEGRLITSYTRQKDI